MVTLNAADFYDSIVILKNNGILWFTIRGKIFFEIITRGDHKRIKDVFVLVNRKSPEADPKW